MVTGGDGSKQRPFAPRALAIHPAPRFHRAFIGLAQPPAPGHCSLGRPDRSQAQSGPSAGSAADKIRSLKIRPAGCHSAKCPPARPLASRPPGYAQSQPRPYPPKTASLPGAIGAIFAPRLVGPAQKSNIAQGQALGLQRAAGRLSSRHPHAGCAFSSGSARSIGAPPRVSAETGFPPRASSHFLKTNRPRGGLGLASGLAHYPMSCAPCPGNYELLCFPWSPI